MKNKLFVIPFVLLITSCGGNNNNNHNGAGSPSTRTEDISIKEKQCMNKLYQKQSPKHYSDIAKLSYDGVIECKLSQQQVIIFINEEGEIENEN
jgi:hypothetical protein